MVQAMNCYRTSARTVIIVLLLIGSFGVGCSESTETDSTPNSSWVGSDAGDTGAPLFPDVDENSSDKSENGDISSNDEAPGLETGACSSADDCAPVPSLGSCFASACVAGTCESLPLGDGTSCTTDELDADLCVTESVCNQGQCVPLPVFCDDANPCTMDTCDSTTGACQYENIGGGCGGLCETDADCSESMEIGACDRALCAEGVCTVAPEQDGSPCNESTFDGNACILGGICDAGTCEAQVIDCNDGDECTADTCDPLTGSCEHTTIGEGCESSCETDLDCANDLTLGDCRQAICVNGVCGTENVDDGQACFRDEWMFYGCIEGGFCQAGTCVSIPKDCNDGMACTWDECDPIENSCSHTEIEDCGDPCESSSDCDAGFYCEEFCKPVKPEHAACLNHEECESDYCAIFANTGWCATPGSQDVGELCKTGLECGSGLCIPPDNGFFTGVCGCTSAQDCPSGTYCDDLSSHLCLNQKPNGEACLSESECISGQCLDGICDQSCGDGAGCGPNQYCNLDALCVDTLAMGLPCMENIECATGRCEGILGANKICVCNGFDDCQAGEYCATFGKNACKPSKNTCDEICTTDNQCGVDAICAGFPGKCVIPGSSAVGQLCCRDAQCGSGACTSDGECVCKADADCPGAQVCDTSLFNTNQCVECLKNDDCAANEYCVVDAVVCEGDVCESNVCVEKSDYGWPCSDNDQCYGGKCQGSPFGICTCDEDEDCAEGEVCRKPLFDMNECVDCINDKDCTANQYCDDYVCKNAGELGTPCSANDHCLSGQCEGAAGEKTCVCADDGDCPSGMVCDVAIFGANTCLECLSDSDCPGGYCTSGMTCQPLKSLGVPCGGNKECETGQCEGPFPDAVCVCATDAECGDGFYCDINLGANECLPVKAVCGATCSADKQCPDGAICKGKPIGKCIFEESKSEGQSCCKDVQCMSGSCKYDICECIADSDCPGELLCLKGGLFGPNSCVSCIEDKDCASGKYCDNNACKSLQTLGQGCEENADCESEKCAWPQKVCVCDEDSDCPAGLECKTFMLNECK